MHFFCCKVHKFNDFLTVSYHLCNLPNSFNRLCKRICKEIVEDLPTVYEMPEEAVEWVEKMLAYTVAGGKMNRGLALMSVHSTLAGNSKL